MSNKLNLNSTSLLWEDRLAQFGYGLFETILVNQKGPRMLNLHYERMKKGAHILNINIPEFRQWAAFIENYLADQSIFPTPTLIPFGLRITLSGGNPNMGIPAQMFITTRKISYTPVQYLKGIALSLLSFPRNELSPLTQLKSTNYMENMLGKEESRANGFEEGLWLNTKGYLAEGTLSNIFFVKGKELFTPAVNCGCLPGTRRQLVLELSESLGIPHHEGNYSPNDLWKADEVFVTNSLMSLIPVRQVGQYLFQVAPMKDFASITRCLALALQKRLEI